MEGEPFILTLGEFEADPAGAIAKVVAFDEPLVITRGGKMLVRVEPIPAAFDEAVFATFENMGDLTPTILTAGRVMGVSIDPVGAPGTSITKIEPVQASYVVQRWDESEAGWGTRPDGWSIHLSQGALDTFVKLYWETMPSSPPHEYDRPSGSPYLVDASKLTAEEIDTVNNPEHPNGYRYFTRNYPDAR